jgi:hypothetical protein
LYVSKESDRVADVKRDLSRRDVTYAQI